MNKIEKQCAICGQSFVPKTVNSVFCSKKCSDVAYRIKKAQQKKAEEMIAMTDNISSERLYISVPEATLMFGVAKSTLYRLIRQKKIPSINLGARLIRIDRVAIEKMFPIQELVPVIKKKQTPKLYSLEPKDCYTIGEISKKYGISDSSVYKHIRKFSVPTRQIGKYVYVPKSEIDNIYNP